MIEKNILESHLKSLIESNSGTILFENENVFKPVSSIKIGKNYRLFEIKGDEDKEIRYIDVDPKGPKLFNLSDWMPLETKTINNDTRYGYTDNGKFIDLSDIEIDGSMKSFNIDNLVSYETNSDNEDQNTDDNSIENEPQAESKLKYSVWYVMREVGREQEAQTGTPRHDVKMCIVVTPTKFPDSQVQEYIKSIDGVKTCYFSKYAFIIEFNDIDERIIMHQKKDESYDAESIPELMENLKENTSIDVVTVKKFMTKIKNLINDLSTRQKMIDKGLVKENN